MYIETKDPILILLRFLFVLLLSVNILIVNITKGSIKNLPVSKNSWNFK